MRVGVFGMKNVGLKRRLSRFEQRRKLRRRLLRRERFKRWNGRMEVNKSTWTHAPKTTPDRVRAHTASCVGLMWNEVRVAAKLICNI